jgi:D-arabinose 1-dehydrogenase-like Zn-dependent alcohol dehydrogenase
LQSRRRCASLEINSKRLKAIVYNRYGGIEALQIQEVEKPSPKDNEVLVKVHAVSINDWDWGKLDGNSLFNRLTSGLWKPKHQILGSDIAGRIEAVGKNVSSFKVGDEVYGDLSGRWGGFAEYCCAHEKALALNQYFYKCTHCQTILKPKHSDCCVFLQLWHCGLSTNTNKQVLLCMN